MIKQLMVVPAVEANPNQVTQQIALYDETGAPLSLSAGFEVSDTYSISGSATSTTALHGPLDAEDFDEDTGNWYNSEENWVALPAGTYQFSVKDLVAGGAYTTGWNVAFHVFDGADSDHEIFPVLAVQETFRIGASRIIHYPEPVYVTFSWNKTSADAASIAFTAIIQKL